VGRTVHHFAAAGVGDELSVRARVTGTYERKGHRFVEIDGIVVDAHRPRRPHGHLPAPRRGGVARGAAVGHCPSKLTSVKARVAIR
jgi:hypothetical protein